MIARGLKRSPSTVSQEIGRNGGCSAYRPSEADTRDWERALRSKPCRLARRSYAGASRTSSRYRVAGADLRLAEAAIPCRPKHAGITRSYLSKPLYSDTRRAEEGALTWDRGKEKADHKSFTIATNVQVYFCDPRSPWQRGSNEITNGLLRQYLPRGTDLSRLSQAYLDSIALRLNQRPRKTLGFEAPDDRLRAALQ
jgi:IS30 family transposase